MRADRFLNQDRTTRVSAALKAAAERRDRLATLKAEGRAGAGAEALCNGALRHAIRLSIETSGTRRGDGPRNISRRQLDRVIRIISRRRFAASAV